MITIRKVKWDGKKVEIHSTETKKGVETEKITRSVQQPSPKFVKVFQSGISHALAILELDGSYDRGHTFAVTGYSFNIEEEDERSGVVMTCQKKLHRTNAPAVFNTPHLREPMKPEEHGQPGFFDDDLGKLMELVREIGVAYLDGERGQLDAFAGVKVETPAQLELVKGGGKKKPTRRKKK